MHIWACFIDSARSYVVTHGTQEGGVEKGAMKKKWVEELTNLGRESVPEVRNLEEMGKAPGTDVLAARRTLRMSPKSCPSWPRRSQSS